MRLPSVVDTSHEESDFFIEVREKHGTPLFPGSDQRMLPWELPFHFQEADFPGGWVVYKRSDWTFYQVPLPLKKIRSLPQGVLLFPVGDVFFQFRAVSDGAKEICRAISSIWDFGAWKREGGEVELLWEMWEYLGLECYSVSEVIESLEGYLAAI